MEVILDSLATAAKLCGEQKPTKTEYRPSRHVLRVEVENGLLLYQTLTGELLFLDEREAASPAGEQRERLINGWYLVPVGFDEQLQARQVRKIITNLSPLRENITSYTVFTTTDCNARCYYCYEKGVKRVTMTANTARDTADYISRKCGGKPVSIRWFGGEPLCNPEAIDIICAGLRDRRVDFSSSMVSNGLLFTPELVERARALWGLKGVQITLDGTEKIYNRTKAYIDGSGNAFDRVMTNIGLLLDSGIRASVRLNMDRNNAEDLHTLTDLLARRFGGREGFLVYPVLLTEFKTKVNGFATEELAAENYLRLERKIRENGMARSGTLARTVAAGRCMADNDGAVCITPEGYLTKCEHFTDTERFGSIYTEETDQALLASWKEQEYYPECDGCPLYPLCINLKKCEWGKKGCPLSVKNVRIANLKQKLVREYASYMERQAEEKSEDNR